MSGQWRLLCVLLLAACVPSAALAFATPLVAVADKIDTRLQMKANSLEGCVCVVTGASRGIGKGIAVELGKKGATVYVTGTSSSSSSSSSSSVQGPYTTNPQVGGPGTVEETASLITELGGKGIAVICNHARDEEVKALFDRVEEEQGRLDILVNNVFRIPQGGLEKLMSKFWQQGVEAWDTLHTVGLRSHFVASMYAVPLMLKSRNGSSKLPRPFIAMISSFGGMSYTFSVPYGVGKAGVDRLAKDMAVELASEDICVVSFYPGVVKTERTDVALENGEWDQYVGIPLDNAESPEFTGRAIVSVATDVNNMRKSGTFQVVAELAQEYSFTDVDGTTPPSIRSFRFLLPAYAMNEETRKKVPDWLIPDIKLPFWIMSQGRPPDLGD
jgi:dehydrogenase/reductase SDR family protein 1